VMFNIFMFVFIAIFFSQCQANSTQTVSQDSENLTLLSKQPQLVQEILRDSFATSIKTKNLPADISFMFLDVKLDPEKEKFKICEFGEGRLADSIYANTCINDQTYKLMTPYWHLLWEYLEQFNLPIWFIGKHPIHDTYFTYASMPMAKFNAIGGIHAHSLKILERSEPFQTLTQNNIKNKTTINNYQGIIVYRHYNTGNPKYYLKLQNFKKKYPQFLVLNSACEPYASNKAFSASLFNDQLLKQFKPQWHLYRKRYRKVLARNISRQFKADKLVIKPINSNRTSGIIVCSTHELNSKLRTVTNTKKASRTPYGIMFKPKHPVGEDYWQHDKNKYFLVEEYCKSKYLELEGKLYDPALRIFLLMHHNNQHVNITVLSGYWKFPPHAITDDVPLSEKNKTDPNKIDKFMGIAISPEDMHYIRNTLHSFMPQVYEKMLQAYKNNFSKLFTKQFHRSEVVR